MIDYILLVFLFFLIGLLLINKGQSRMLKILSVSMALFAGFRHDVGVDYDSYVKIFEGEIGYVT